MSFAWDQFSPVALAVLILLAGFSVASWTILVAKAWQLDRWSKATRSFVAFVWATRDFPTIAQGLSTHRASPLVRLFEAAEVAPSDAGLKSRVLRRRADEVVEEIGALVPFLGTTAATTPFIGLFGTVWGIMEAFGQIGRSGSTSLALVAPGISEALVTTAVGLVVAIPAVVGYNALQGPIRRLTAEVDQFCDDLLALGGGS